LSHGSLFVIVHGAWHDGDVLTPVIRYLRSRGHIAHAPTLAGHGRGVAKSVTHDDCVRSLVDYVTDHDLQDIVLVGHSFAGTVIARAAPLIAKRVRRLVFWNAFVLADGECLLDAAPPHYRALFDGLAAQSQDNTVMLPFPLWRDGFINDSSEETARGTYELLSPEPYGLFVEKLDLRAFYALIDSRRVGCSFINCTEDVSLPPGPEWGWYPRMSGRLGECRVVHMPGSHEVLFTNPVGIAESIIVAGRD
jgi:pimeloyl-ACP methyl ester carboxylesterase